MALSIVEAIERIKAGVAKCLTAESIEKACRTGGHSWRQREVGPVQTVWTFLVDGSSFSMPDTPRLNRTSVSLASNAPAAAFRWRTG